MEISISERGSSTPLISVATNELGAYRCGGPSRNRTRIFFKMAALDLTLKSSVDLAAWARCTVIGSTTSAPARKASC